MKRSIDDVETEIIQRVEARRAKEREATLAAQPWRQRRPKRGTIWVKPKAPYLRVMLASGDQITEPTEVSAGDSWIQRRLADEELELTTKPEPVPPPPPPTEEAQPEPQPVPEPQPEQEQPAPEQPQ